MSHGTRRAAAIAVGATASILVFVSGAVAAVVGTEHVPTRDIPSVAPSVVPVAMPQITASTVAATPVVFTVAASRPVPAVRLLPSADGISAVALTAYRRAAASQASCAIPWQLVAAIGYIESDDGQIGGNALDAQGNETSPVEGIPLDGSGGVARILDGKGKPVRAEGPLQFIPSTWALWGADGNGDGVQDPQNIFDASTAAARYLCSSGGKLAAAANQPAAIRLYNDSPIYVKNVMNVERAYVAGLSAATVTLIPMPTCPGGKAKPGQPATPGCPAAPKKKAKHAKHAKHKTAHPAVTVVATRRSPAPVAPKPSSSPQPTATRTPTPTPTPVSTPVPPASTPTPTP